MWWLRRVLPMRGRVAYWTAPVETGWPRPGEVLSALHQRWSRYAQGEVDMRVTPHDDMYVNSPDGSEHYRLVGLSGLNLVIEAMLLAGRTSFGSVLDLPCGGGRITRHLVRFLDDAEIFVDDIEERKKRAVLEQFPVHGFEAPRDFAAPPSRQFDLILVGSLLTHLDEAMFRRAVDYLIAALAPGGILIVTLHGRLAATTMRRVPAAKATRPAWLQGWIGRFRERRPILDFIDTGFGYAEMRSYTEAYGHSYGGAFTSPRWVMGLVESRPDVMVLGYRERAFATHQDVLTLQKLKV